MFLFIFHLYQFMLRGCDCHLSVKGNLTWLHQLIVASWVSRVCDWLARRRRESLLPKCLQSLWRSCCTIQTTNRSRYWRHSCMDLDICRCHSRGYWTGSHWRSKQGCVTLSTHHRRLRCTRPPSVGTYQPHHWWRTSSIQPSTTDQTYAGSAHTYKGMLLKTQTQTCVLPSDRCEKQYPELPFCLGLKHGETCPFIRWL